MKKYSLIFVLSFILYIPPFLISLEMMSGVWEDICLFAFIVSALYQLLYIFYLRRRENVGLGKTIALFFLYFFISFIIRAALYCIGIFFNGSEPVFFGGGDPVYGLEALKSDFELGLIYNPISLIGVIYLVAFFVTKELRKRKKKEE